VDLQQLRVRVCSGDRIVLLSASMVSLSVNDVRLFGVNKLHDDCFGFSTADSDASNDGGGGLFNDRLDESATIRLPFSDGLTTQ
jgi:hypothetical protein